MGLHLDRICHHYFYPADSQTCHSPQRELSLQFERQMENVSIIEAWEGLSYDLELMLVGR